jgi:acetoacetate decarboxylase
MKSSYFIPKEKLKDLMRGSAMCGQEGIYLYGITDPSVKRFLPPPLEFADPDHPVLYVYIVAIREPTFSPWYMEGGIGVLAKYKEKTGVYFFSLMLSGPGAQMGMVTGRESSGLPKKLSDRITVERTDEYGHCCVERGGVRLIDVELEIGQYNEPQHHFEQEGCQSIEGGLLTEGGCFLHKYNLKCNWDFADLELLYYDSPTRYYSWEPASAVVKLQSSIDDPWGEIPIHSIIGVGWAKNDNIVRDISTMYRYSEDSIPDTMQYLFTSRYDRCLLCREHQQYGL